jgi:large subunit ribosomal protein L29
MKELKGKELRTMETVELKAKYTELKEEHFNLRYQLAIGQCSNPARFKQLKRDIARVITVAKERDISFR